LHQCAAILTTLSPTPSRVSTPFESVAKSCTRSGPFFQQTRLMDFLRFTSMILTCRQPFETTPSKTNSVNYALWNWKPGSALSIHFAVYTKRCGSMNLSTKAKTSPLYFGAT
jgi:hypothetical protein